MKNAEHKAFTGWSIIEGEDVALDNYLRGYMEARDDHAASEDTTRDAIRQAATSEGFWTGVIVTTVSAVVFWIVVEAGLAILL